MRRRQIPGEPDPPSKGELKRHAQALQDLGERLIAAPSALLGTLQLPDQLADAIREARGITSYSALARQKLFVGKLLRQLDTAPIHAALETYDGAHRTDTLSFRRIETWRDRLLEEGHPALEALLAECPDADAQGLERLIREAHRELDAGAPPRARRQLFRALRKLLEPV